MARRSKSGDDQPATGLRAHPLVKLLLADVVVRGAGRLVRSQTARKFISQRIGLTPGAVAEKPSLKRRVAGAIALRVATRSVPGAVVVGTGLIAHGLYKRGKARRAARQAAGVMPPTDGPASS